MYYCHIDYLITKLQIIAFTKEKINKPQKEYSELKCHNDEHNTDLKGSEQKHSSKWV